MVIIKSASDIKKMKIAGEISVNALKIAKDALAAGVTTLSVDKEVTKYIISRNAKPAFLGYQGFPNATCISINNELIHGIPSNNRKVSEGDIVSIDVGVIYDRFYGDNAATFAIGEISEEDSKLLAVTKECLIKAIAIAVGGNRLGDIGYTIENHAHQNGFSIVEAYQGHGLGRKLHEDPSVLNFGIKGRGIKLIPGMTIAIEPMVNAGVKDIYVDPVDGWTVKTMDNLHSAHFEMSIAITDNDPIILTDWREVI
ncbi:MAG: type I methionyl aminopeptidase [Oscillospiraceae bacterium]|nr:type I methionyl aminopeptidase [Oscillospiraceae bacterium]